MVRNRNKPNSRDAHHEDKKRNCAYLKKKRNGWSQVVCPFYFFN